MSGVKSAEWGKMGHQSLSQHLAETNRFHLFNLRLDLVKWPCFLEQMDNCDGCHRALEMLKPLKCQCSDSVSVSVSQGCCNKLSHTWWLQAMEMCSLSALEVRSLKPGCGRLWGRMWSRPLSWLLWLLAALDILGVADASFQFPSPMSHGHLLSVCVCVVSSSRDTGLYNFTSRSFS